MNEDEEEKETRRKGRKRFIEEKRIKWDLKG